VLRIISAILKTIWMSPLARHDDQGVGGREEFARLNELQVLPEA
jgi:hypothetical protein